MTKRVTMTDRDEQVEREGGTEGAEELQYAYGWHCVNKMTLWNQNDSR